MPILPILHQDAATREALRRGMRHHRLRIRGCRSVERIDRWLREVLVDGIVVDVRAGWLDNLIDVTRSYPRIPIFAYSAFRPDDGRLIGTCLAAGFHVLVIGVDESIAGDYIGTRTGSAVRRQALKDAPRLLGLTENLQLRAWDEVLALVDTPPRTTCVAKALGMTREHLSREFAAGGAPNLKRVIDLARLACASHLLENPGYTIDRVARILRYASSSHLAGSARRIAGARPSRLAAMGPRGILAEFHRGRTRSRLW